MLQYTFIGHRFKKEFERSAEIIRYTLVLVGILLVFAPSEDQRAKISDAMEELQKLTCLTFPEYNEQVAQELGHNQRIIFNNVADGLG